MEPESAYLTEEEDKQIKELFVAVYPSPMERLQQIYDIVDKAIEMAYDDNAWASTRPFSEMDDYRDEGYE